MSEKRDTERIRPSQVAASALAAVTAALLGSTMGVAGTVIGAGVASVISTVGGVLYLRSFQRTKESMRLVRTRVVARAGSATVTVPERTDADGAADERAGAPSELDEERERTDSPTRQAPTKRRTWRLVVGGSLVAFVLGMGVVTGVEWLRGAPLSGGEGTTFGEIIQPRPTGDVEPERTPPPPPTSDHSPPPTTVETETATETVTVTPTAEPSDPSTPPQTTTPPATTGSGPSGSAPSSSGVVDSR